jgi:hypothetical protein
MKFHTFSKLAEPKCCTQMLEQCKLPPVSVLVTYFLGACRLSTLTYHLCSGGARQEQSNLRSSRRLHLETSKVQVDQTSPNELTYLGPITMPAAGPAQVNRDILAIPERKRCICGHNCHQSWLILALEMGHRNSCCIDKL